MCGLSAVFAPQGTQLELSQTVVGMNEVIAHRGPDDEGYLLGFSNGDVINCFGNDTHPDCHHENVRLPGWQNIDSFAELPVNFALGHRRLSIVDPGPGGHQPMQDANFGVQLIYNGEIYNHPELRAELVQLGHSFFTQCDSEVLIKAWIAWGEECLDRFNGMFAFVLVDTRQRRVFAARDRFGIKPMYYAFGPDGSLHFASEIKQFTTIPGWCSTLNAQRAYDFLAWEALDHTDETLFDGVFQLRGGQAVTFELNSLEKHGDGRLPVQQWYTISEIAPTDYSDGMASAASKFRTQLEDSVRLRLRADVTVGSCLSGGLDSSSIVVLMDRLLAAEGAAGPSTFSAYSTEASINEEKWVDKLLSEVNADAHNVTPDRTQLADQLDPLIWHQDEPFISNSIYAQWSVFELAARSGVKVMLDGQGADEQLGGYPASFGMRFYEMIRKWKLGQCVAEMRAAKSIHGFSWLTMVAWSAEYFLPAWLASVGRRLLGANQGTPGWVDIEHKGIQPGRPVAHTKRGLRSLNELGRYELLVCGLPALLHWEDRNSMAHSIEARVPFLDVNLVEYLMRQPTRHKINRGTTKLILRESMAGLLPEAIRCRQDKIGFQMAEQGWLTHSHTKKMILRDIRYAVDHSSKLLKPSALSLAEQMLDGQARYRSVVWRWFCFGAWLRIFDIKFRPDEENTPF